MTIPDHEKPQTELFDVVDVSSYYLRCRFCNQVSPAFSGFGVLLEAERWISQHLRENQDCFNSDSLKLSADGRARIRVTRQLPTYNEVIPEYEDELPL